MRFLTMLSNLVSIIPTNTHKAKSPVSFLIYYWYTSHNKHADADNQNKKVWVEKVEKKLNRMGGQ